LWADQDYFRAKWADVTQMADLRLDCSALAEQADQPEAVPSDLFCDVAYNVSIQPRRQRVDCIKKEQAALFAFFCSEAKVRWTSKIS